MGQLVCFPCNAGESTKHSQSTTPTGRPVSVIYSMWDVVRAIASRFGGKLLILSVSYVA
jgi:hypothetical protein